MFQLVAPEGEIGAGLAALVPARQSLGHAADDEAASPPCTRRTSPTSMVAKRSHHSASRRRPVVNVRTSSPSPAAAASLISRAYRLKTLLDDLDQFLDARIADAVLAGRRQRKQSLKAEDVPRIDEGAAGDAAVQQILDLRQPLRRLAQASLIGLDLPARQPARGSRSAAAPTRRGCAAPRPGWPPDSPSRRTAAPGSAAATAWRDGGPGKR